MTNERYASNLEMLAALKRMTRLADSLEGRLELRIDLICIELAESFDEYGLAWIKGETGVRRNCILIEWVQYDLHWTGDVAEELLGRVKARVELLNSSELPPTFLALPCLGWYQNTERKSFALLFRYPISCDLAKSPPPGPSSCLILSKTAKDGLYGHH